MNRICFIDIMSIYLKTMEKIIELHPIAQVAAIIMIGLVVCIIAYGLFVKD